MRIAALYDIHGNLPALDAVLAEVDAIGVDLILIGGDVVPGPMPREVFARLAELDVPIEAIRGNGEVAVLAERTDRDSGYRLPEPVREAIRWTSAELRPEDVATIESWPRTLQHVVDGLGSVLFCHATPRDENELFTRLTPAAELEPIFSGLGAATIVCGHTHMPFDRSIGDVRVVNAGSVGMPFGDPRAHWLLLGPEVEPRRTTYDLTAAAKTIRATGHPQAERLANELPQPRSEEEMLALFSGT